MKNSKVKPTVEQMRTIQIEIVEKRTATFACSIAKISFRSFNMMLNDGAEIHEQQLLKILRYAKSLQD